MRFVGDPVACVVAETALQAKDAAEAVELDIEPLPAVTLRERGGEARRAAALRRRAGNVSLDFLFGEPEKVAAGLCEAPRTSPSSA